MSTDLRVRFVEAPAGVRLAREPYTPGRSPRSAAPAKRARADRRDPGPSVVAEATGPAQEAAVRTSPDAPPPEPPPPEPPRADPRAKADEPPAPIAAEDGAAHAAGESEARVAEALSDLGRRAAEIEAQLERALAELEPAVLRLALAVARRVIGAELESGRADIRSLIEPALHRALAGASESAMLRVRAGSAALAVVKKAIESRGEMSHPVRIEPAPDLEPYSCELECDMRRVVSGVGQALERLEAAVLSGGDHG